MRHTVLMRQATKEQIATRGTKEECIMTEEKYYEEVVDHMDRDKRKSVDDLIEGICAASEQERKAEAMAGEQKDELKRAEIRYKNELCRDTYPQPFINVLDAERPLKEQLADERLADGRRHTPRGTVEMVFAVGKAEPGDTIECEDSGLMNLGKLTQREGCPGKVLNFVFAAEREQMVCPECNGGYPDGYCPCCKGNW